MHRPSYHSGELRPLQPEPFLVISQGLYLCDGTLSYLVLYTAIKSQMYWFTCLSTPPAMTTNVKSILILQSVQSNISLLMMGWKKKSHLGKKKSFLQESCFLSSAYQTPLKATLLHYVSQRAPERELLTQTRIQSKPYEIHTRPFAKLTFPFWGNLQLLL